MSEPIDWVQLDQEIRDRNRQATMSSTKIYSSSQAMIGIELIIGEDRLREAVDYHVADKPEAELVRHVLRQLRPLSAMQRCYEIYKTNTNIYDRRAALNLLGDIADGRVLDWIDEFLADPDEGIQTLGIGVLDRIVWGGGIRQNEAAMEKVYKLLDAGESHSNLHVRSTAASIRAYLVKDEAFWDEVEAYRASLKKSLKETMS